MSNNQTMDVKLITKVLALLTLPVLFGVTAITPSAGADSRCEIGGTHTHFHLAKWHRQDTHEYWSAKQVSVNGRTVFDITYINSTHGTFLAPKRCG